MVEIIVGSMLLAAAPAEHPSLASSAVKVITSLLMVLGVLLTGLYWSKRLLRKEGIGSKGTLVRVLGSTYIGVKKSICLVEVPGSILVLGITRDSISMLTRIENKELQDPAMSQNSEPQGKSHWEQVNDRPCPSGAERGDHYPRQLFAFMKGRMLDLKNVRRLRPRLYPVTAAKDANE